MSFFFMKHDDQLLYKYLDRGEGQRNAKIRTLEARDLEWIDILRKRNRDFNILITEMITVKKVLEKVDRSGDLLYIRKNMERVTTSLCKQRRYGYRLKRTIMTTVPIRDEPMMIDECLKRFEERIQYIRKVILPENLDLTPIREYVRILGDEDFTTDIYRHFGTRAKMYEANTDESDAEIEKYASDILAKVREHGMEEKYVGRLEEYLKADRAREERRKTEERREKQEKNALLARDGMTDFQRMFHEGIRTLKGCDRIHMGWTSVEKMLGEYGRDSWLILCCYIHNNKCIYRYAGAEGKLVPRFINAWVFPDEKAAKDAMEEMRGVCPEKMFDVVKMGYTFEDLAYA